MERLQISGWASAREKGHGILKMRLLTTVDSNTEGNASLQLGYFHYSVSKDVDDAMFFKWGDGDVKFTQGTYVPF